MKKLLCSIAVFVLTVALSAGTVLATEKKEPARPWTDVADFSLIVTTGNAQNTNVGASNKFMYKWAKSDFTFDASLLRAETNLRFLSNPDGQVDVSRVSSTTAALYTLGGMYRYFVDDRFNLYGDAGWLRNEFAGIADRYNFGGGVGYLILKDNFNTLSGEGGLEFMNQKPIQGDSSSFPALRGYLGYNRKLSNSARFTTDFTMLEDLKHTGDLRLNTVFAVVANLTKKVALKTSYTMLYQRQPVEILVPGDTPLIPSAVFAYDKLDTIFASSLVINF